MSAEKQAPAPVDRHEAAAPSAAPAGAEITEAVIRRAFIANRAAGTGEPLEGRGTGLGMMGKGAGGAGLGLRSQGFGNIHGVLGGKRNTEDHDPREPSAGPPGASPSRIHGFVETTSDALSTFAVDVDTASYTHARRQVNEGTLPAPETVRVEEFLNYFHYRYAAPTEDALTVQLDAAPSPFTPGRHLLRVGVQGRRLSVAERKPAHLTFLVDVSGSMSSPDRLPLAKRALRLLVDQLRDGDTVALVTYAGAVRLVLPPTGLEHKATLHAAIEDLTAGGATAMASGIELAYQQASRTLDGHSLSRVIILSDGDANVGPTHYEALLALIQRHVKEGVTLTTVGFGLGNYQDATMEQLADRGNGNHYYVDSLMAARRIFQEQLGSTLEVIAQDVKLQVEFDPKQVERYRLVGYENRDIADRDFRNDRVDAGEMGAGHTVTALYELVLRPGAGAGLATVRVRAKRPRGETATERAYAFDATALAPRFSNASQDFRFAAAVMGAAELLRRSPHAERWSLENVLSIARAATPPGDVEREEFITWMERARPLLHGVAAR
ncbi:vWA domain-containing protein [Citreicoccus inhibens]|uniref:vWA domain-containing protein n=1 Tax=Citreicoccus inhibens TaxID=2849499 RepID=UPI001F251B10|nr:von Willebrand factor type A domain-containing protein [Citreicoccus inhibens]